MKSFVNEHDAIAGARDNSSHGGRRNYRAASARI